MASADTSQTNSNASKSNVSKPGADNPSACGDVVGAIWHRPGFVDLFGDVCGGARSALGKEAPLVGLAELRASFQMTRAVLLVLGAEGAGGREGREGMQLSGAHDAIACAADGFGLGLELLSLMREGGEHAALLSLLEQLVPMVSSLGVHKSVAVPLAWGAGGGALVLVLHRTDDAYFSVSVCNCGEGVDRHPCRHPSWVRGRRIRENVSMNEGEEKVGWCRRKGRYQHEW